MIIDSEIVLALLRKTGIPVAEGLGDSSALLYAAIRDLLIDGDFNNANRLVHGVATLSPGSRSIFYSLFFSDPLLAEILLSSDLPEDPCFTKAQNLLSGRFPMEAIRNNLDRLECEILPMAVLYLHRHGAIDKNDEKRLSSRKDVQKVFVRFSIALASCSIGEFDRGLQIMQSHFSAPLGILLLFECYTLKENKKFLTLLQTYCLSKHRTLTVLVLQQIMEQILQNNPISLLNEETLSKITYCIESNKCVEIQRTIEENKLDSLMKQASIFTELELDGVSGLLLKNLLSSEKKNLEALLRLSEIHERSGNWKQVCKILGFIEKEVPKEPEVKRRLVISYMSLNLKEKALKKLGELLQLTPEDVNTLRQILQLKIEVHGIKHAGTEAKALLQQIPTDLEALKVIATLAPKDKLEEAWMNVLKVDPLDKDALNMIRRIKQHLKNHACRELVDKANQFLAEGDEHRAEQQLRELIYLDQNYLPGYAALADLLESQQRRNESLVILKQALCVENSFEKPDLWTRTGILAWQLKELKDAEELLSEVRSKFPTDQLARITLLRVRRELALKGELETSFEELLTRYDDEFNNNPEDILLRVERGYLQQFMPSYVKINHRESGLADLDAGRRALIDQKIYWEFSLSALLQEDRFSDAMKLLELMEQKGLETIRSRDMLIQYALECQLDSAEPLYEHLLQSDIGNPLIIDICSKRLLPWKEETELLKVMDYLRCLKKEVNEKEPISLFQLGLAYVELSEASRQISGDTMGMAMDLFRQILNRDESLRSVYGAINRTILAVYHRIPEILENGSKYIEKAHQLFPEDPYILGLMGYLLDGTGGADKKQDAANFFEESLRWDYTQPRIHHALAGIYRFQKNHQKATFHYRLVLELSRDIKLKDEAERALNYLKRMESEG